jgi:DNA-binding NarL/FixJ family response regulator
MNAAHRKVAAGQALLQPEIASKLAESMARPELSERELQVLQYMALGRSNKEIGQVLYISENTVCRRELFLRDGTTRCRVREGASRL